MQYRVGVKEKIAMDAMVGNCRKALTAMLMKLSALLAEIDPELSLGQWKNGRSGTFEFSGDARLYRATSGGMM